MTRSVLAAMLGLSFVPAWPVAAQESPAADTLRQIVLLLGGNPEKLPATPAEEILKGIRSDLSAASVGALGSVRSRLGIPAEAVSPVGDTPEKVAADIQRLLSPPTAAVQPQPGTKVLTLGLPASTVKHPNPLFLERSLLFPGQQGLILEAQIAPHVYLAETQTSKKYLEKGGLAFAVSVTPMFRIRIRDEESAPVQTLSFMPKLNAQLFRLRRDDAEKRLRATMWGLQGVWGHHSNGQTECIFVPGVSGDDPRCTAPATLAQTQINYPNGSFSTNYLAFGGFWRLMKLAPSKEGVLSPHATHLIGATLEVNPDGLPPGGSLEPELRELYGTTRLKLVYEYERRTKRTRGIWAGSLRLGGAAELIDKTTEAGSRRWRYTGELAWTPDWFRGSGFTARYVNGQDYYNLQFTRNISWFQFGLVIDTPEFEPFH